MESPSLDTSKAVVPALPLFDTPPNVPPPPYFKTYFINPSSFKATVNAKVDNPVVSLFRLSIRLFQFAFALASGISYAVELKHGGVSPPTNFIYAEVVFGFTLLMLVFDSITVRYYRFCWMVEWILAILWFVCFAIFYTSYLYGPVEQGCERVNMGRMKTGIWCDLFNALLWLTSALFSSVMCCSGIKATIEEKLLMKRQSKEKKNIVRDIEEMETGIIGEGSNHS